MFRGTLALASLLAAIPLQIAFAQGYPQGPVDARAVYVGSHPGAPSRLNAQPHARPISMRDADVEVEVDANVEADVAAAPVVAPYPQINAPLYPCPVQRVPIQTGATVITNQALAPHEMLYPHEYRAMYGPFYYRVKGTWIVTPFGVRSHDKWELQGTEVRVKYRSKFGLLSGFIPPHIN